MPQIDLFLREHIVGVFRGFREGGLEFHAELALPYRNEFQSSPMHGQFLLVQLETPHEAVLGRIASFSSEGKLSFGSGEEFTIRAVRENRVVPEDLREQYLKYRVNIRVLGVLRNNHNGTLTFVASHRRLPHVGSVVAFPSAEVLREIAGHNVRGAAIGHFALGEYIYCGTDEVSTAGSGMRIEEWMQLKTPNVLIRFPISSLVSRRTFIFARAGFGKSNLNKLLFSKLYEETPTVLKRGGRHVPVGTVIFDPDGEYFWPDDKGRPGLCDVPALQDKLVVFTPRKNTSAFYQSFVAGGIRLDIRQLKPADVIGIALSPDRQDQQNVRKLRALDQGRWKALVELVDEQGNQAPIGEICRILDLSEKTQEVEALAARGNMASIVHAMHDRSSQLMDMLLKALSLGKLCVVDVSQMRGAQAMILSGLILRRIFDRNQQEFTAAEPKTIPTIAVIEEAQSVLVEQATSAEPYIAWVKEGRKYDQPAAQTFAAELREDFWRALEQPLIDRFDVEDDAGRRGLDVRGIHERRAIDALRNNADLMRKLQSEGVAWGALRAFLANQFPETMEEKERGQAGYDLIPTALTELFGARDDGWHAFQNQQRGTTYAKKGRRGG